MDAHKLTYIFKNLSLAYEIETSLIEHVSFGSINDAFKKKVHVLIHEDEPVDTPIHVKWKNKSIPFLFNKHSESNIIEVTENGVLVRVDVLSPIFYLLSGEQEINGSKDTYGRFMWKGSLQEKHNITMVPVVNYYMDILVKALEKSLQIAIPFKQNETQVFLTHDVDEVNSAWKKRVRLALEEKHYGKAIKFYLAHKFNPYFPWRNLQDIAKAELDLGFTPIFFFLPKRDKVKGIANADYRMEEPYLRETVKFLKRNNVSLGLHGSYRTHDKLKKFLKEKKTFEKAVYQEINWNRFHWLQFDVLKTPSVLEQSGITHDTTLGFQEQVGFRNGVCTPFYLYNHEQKRPSHVIEYPLSVMDCSLSYPKYMNLNVTEAKKSILKLHQEITKFNGVMILNYHNTFLSDFENGEWNILYKNLIHYISSIKAEN